ncbi:cytochrome P450 [Actinoplanes sp. NPDC049599]|uniref:cytochrome P450 n=1 Tax=Actinoplanes sp. NPDC049599 TaxID=3363903 RepID=UPI003791085C
MTVPATDAPAYPIGRECPYRPSPRNDALRARGPLAKVTLYDGSQAWLVTGYAQARQLLADPRVSIDPHRDGFPFVSPDMAGLEDTGYTDALIGVDPPVHTRQRAMLISSFSARRMKTLRPVLQTIVDERIDAMIAAGPGADLVSAFSVPVPSMAICVLMGVPYEDREAFEKPARALFDPDAAHAEQAMADMTAYFDDVVGAKLQRPGDGLLDDLIAEQVRHGHLTRAELVQYAMLMLIAGQDTTANVISLGIMALLEHPEQFAALRDDPGLAAGAVEEIMRYVSLIEAISRVAVEDIDIAGVRIRAGEGVLIGAAAANFSTDLVASPEELDVRREPRHHLGFGHGVHQCIGQNLARLELELVFREIPRRLPGLRLAIPAAQVRTSVTGPLERVESLPVTW